MRRSFVLPLVPALASALLLAWLSTVNTPAAGLPASPEVQVVSDATRLFRRAVGTPSAAIPASVMRRARAIAAFPGATKEGDAYSAEGIVSIRGADPRRWTPPAVIMLSGEIPVPLDLDSIDFLVVALTPNGVEYLRRPKATLTGPFVIAPGPLGQDARINMDVDLLGYMQFGDFFAGVTIGEVALHEMKDANARIYGRPLGTAAVFQEHVRVPVFAQIWRNALASYFREMS